MLLTGDMLQGVKGNHRIEGGMSDHCYQQALRLLVGEVARGFIRQILIHSRV